MFSVENFRFAGHQRDEKMDKKEKNNKWPPLTERDRVPKPQIRIHKYSYWRDAIFQGIILSTNKIAKKIAEKVQQCTNTELG